MKKIKTELGEIPLGKPANVINNTSDVVKVLGKDFSGSSWKWVNAISKNLPFESMKQAINIFNELKDLDLIEVDDIIWSFKKEV